MQSAKRLACHGAGEMHMAQYFDRQGFPRRLCLLPVITVPGSVDMAQKLGRLLYLFFAEDRYLPAVVLTGECREGKKADTYSPLAFQTDVVWRGRDEMRACASALLQEASPIHFDADFLARFYDDCVSGSDELGCDKRVQVNGCAFCSPVTREQQTLFSYKGFTVLVNHVPYLGVAQAAHFLIVPQGHLEDWCQLSLEQIYHYRRLQTALVRAMSQCYAMPCQQVMTLLQNGNCAGQTVPHTHMHVLFKPQREIFLQAVVYQAEGYYRRMLSRDEMAAKQAEILPYLRANLI
jgi:diadenosine tetraphosphate (Ap4A) HIT family hydrolase